MCFLNVQEQVDRKEWYDNVFFASHNMIQNYLNYRDIVFINRRLTRTRFGRTLLLICGVNNQGRNILFGVCLLTKEDEDGLTFFMENFDKAFAQCPKLLILEKCSFLKTAIQRFFPNVRVLYDY